MDVLWITEAEVVRMMSLREALPALAAGLRLEAQGHAVNMVKTHVGWETSNLHAIGASMAGAGLVGTKTWAHTEGGTCPLLLLFDAGSGSLRAIIEAFALGQMRTAGISGVATDLLARADAEELAIIGTGKQALAQVAAVAAVRPLVRVRVYSPTPARREQFAARVRDDLGLEAVVASSAEEALDGALIVTLVTRATQSFASSAMLARGAHVNAIGAITPEREEIARDALVRCDHIVVDSPPSARKLSKELRDYLGDADEAWARVSSLSHLLASGERRPSESDLTLFKAMGMGISDLALGAALYERAVIEGIGRLLPQPVKVAPRLES